MREDNQQAFRRCAPSNNDGETSTTDRKLSLQTLDNCQYDDSALPLTPTCTESTASLGNSLDSDDDDENVTAGTGAVSDSACRDAHASSVPLENMKSKGAVLSQLLNYNSAASLLAQVSMDDFLSIERNLSKIGHHRFGNVYAKLSRTFSPSLQHPLTPSASPPFPQHFQNSMIATPLSSPPLSATSTLNFPPLPASVYDHCFLSACAQSQLVTPSISPSSLNKCDPMLCDAQDLEDDSDDLAPIKKDMDDKCSGPSCENDCASHKSRYARRHMRYEPTTTTIDGHEYVQFWYSYKSSLKQYTLRTDVDQVDLEDIDDDFKQENCIYPRADVPPDQYHGNRYVYENECNQLGWRLAWLNRSELAGKRGLVQRAVDSYRNQFTDMRSRRTTRHEKHAQEDGDDEAEEDDLRSLTDSDRRHKGGRKRSRKPSHGDKNSVTIKSYSGLTISDIDNMHRQEAQRCGMALTSKSENVGAELHYFDLMGGPRVIKKRRVDCAGTEDAWGESHQKVPHGCKKGRNSPGHTYAGACRRNPKSKSFVIEDPTLHVKHRIKVNIDSVSVEEVNETFKAKNSVFKRGFENASACPVPSRTEDQERARRETCNAVAWKLAWLNPKVLANKKTLLQQAVDQYRTRFMPDMQPRMRSQQPAPVGPLRLTDANLATLAGHDWSRRVDDDANSVCSDMSGSTVSLNHGESTSVAGDPSLEDNTYAGLFDPLQDEGPIASPTAQLTSNLDDVPAYWYGDDSSSITSTSSFERLTPEHIPGLDPTIYQTGEDDFESFALPPMVYPQQKPEDSLADHLLEQYLK
ncbi:hypothetical protein BZG36_01748 [Bifiguratus adelaidae]|uniref:DUF8032 domain-containing protein n=1 Tax=Bifiguratus adelaidae TaxID=1938954 RepID=A0A261Y2X4_9FUNG|nr:hypothetical protein BZG36_01748 [Bifiguratus adelaidae]